MWLTCCKLPDWRFGISRVTRPSQLHQFPAVAGPVVFKAALAQKSAGRALSCCKALKLQYVRHGQTISHGRLVRQVRAGEAGLTA